MVSFASKHHRVALARRHQHPVDLSNDGQELFRSHFVRLQRQQNELAEHGGNDLLSIGREFGNQIQAAPIRDN